MHKKLNFVLNNIIDSEDYSAVFENRPRKFMFGSNNYGEIPGLMNEADGDAWDVFAPGYSYKQLNFKTRYKIKDIIGVFKLQNNNHKIAIRVYANDFDEENAKKEIKRYVYQYKKFTRKRGYWMAFDSKFNWNNL